MLKYEEQMIPKDDFEMPLDELFTKLVRLFSPVWLNFSLLSRALRAELTTPCSFQSTKPSDTIR